MVPKPIRFVEVKEGELELITESLLLQMGMRNDIYIEIDFFTATYESFFLIKNIQVDEATATLSFDLENRLLIIHTVANKNKINSFYKYKHKNNSL